jgi:hypothetical protein
VQGRISFSIKLVATAASSGTGTSYETTNVDGLINNVVAGFIPA